MREVNFDQSSHWNYSNQFYFNFIVLMESLNSRLSVAYFNQNLLEDSDFPKWLTKPSGTISFHGNTYAAFSMLLKCILVFLDLSNVSIFI